MRTNFTRLILTSCLAFSVLTTLSGQYPGSGQTPIDPESIPKFVDYLPHFAGMRVNAKAGGNLIIKAVMNEQVAVSTGTVLDNGVVGTDPEAGKGNYFVYSISADGGKTWTLPLWPSFTIEAQRNRELNVEIRNELDGLTYKDVNITVDQTIMMEGVPLTGDPQTVPYSGPVPIALHLHGGEVPSASDGGPHSWFTPGYAMKGKGWEQGVTSVLRYPNKQEAATLWYHEHSQLGLTRVNVYAGMAGFYFLRGLDEENSKLPGWSKDDLVQEVTPQGKVADALHPDPYLPEIEIVIQDRMFDTEGKLYYPVDPPNPDVHPFWSPEFFGDVITVNGKTWPYLSVAPRKYRFHILDGSNARFYNLWLQDLSKNLSGPSIIQIGTDGGLLDSPVEINPAAGKKLLLAPGERADVIIDFSKVAPGTVLTLMNNANAPFPDGDDVVKEGTTDRIMQFIVNGKMVSRHDHKVAGTDKSAVPKNLRTQSLTKLTDFNGALKVQPDVVRQLTLNEVMSENGPLMVLINNSRFKEMQGMMDMFGEVTEKPVEGTVEEWQLINLTMDAHPMHMHLVQFQLVKRQKFDDMKYMHDYMHSFSGVNGGMDGMYMGAEGPPFKYDVKNSDGAVGGNIPVSGYLMGAPILPEPNERGWKDVIKAYPGEVTTYLVRYAPTELPVHWPKQLSLYPFDPSSGPGYVWHCHIVEHEDNDMMRPLNVEPNPARGKFKRYIDKENSKAARPDGFSLEQNTPNPFLTETEIRFNLPYDCHIELTLFNSSGTVIRKIIDSEAAGGSHTVRMSAESLPSGIYFYRLKTGDYTETKKLVVGKK